MDKGGTININSVNVSFTVPYTTSTGYGISMTFSAPGMVLHLMRDGTSVKSWELGPYSSTYSSGNSVNVTYSVPSAQRSYTVPEDGQYQIVIKPYMSGSTSYWYWTCSSGSGTISFDVTTKFYFSFSKKNYEYTQIGNDGFAQVMGSGFFFSNSTTFIVKRGNYMLRITSSGIQKSINNGQTWTSL